MATTDTPTIAQSLLALYGALDQAVTATGDPEIEAIVERYLPGSTGGNAGWYDELLGFLADLDPRLAEPPETPDLSRALSAMTLRREESTEEEAISPVQLSRMAYAIGALSQLPSYYPPGQWDAQFAQALSLAGPERGTELLDLMRAEFNARDDWPHVMGLAQQRMLIGSNPAKVPLCQTKAKWVRGHLCVVLTTDFASSTVSLDQVKDVVDPLNWDNCLPFFCLMEYRAPRADGWSRVLEHVSTTCSIAGTPQMVTPLKYWKGPRTGEVLAPPAAWVDYELDDQPLPDGVGDGRMVVDEGFIRMMSTVGNAAQPGVRIRTRKVAGFRNLAWFPGALFACVMGYADQGVELLLGGVSKRPPGASSGWKDWQPSTPPAGPVAPAPLAAPAAEAPDPSRRAVVLAVDMLNDCIEDMSDKSAALAAKWVAGAAPVAESLAFTAEVAARLATDPWRFLERLKDPTQGGTP